MSGSAALIALELAGKMAGGGIAHRFGDLGEIELSLGDKKLSPSQAQMNKIRAKSHSHKSGKATGEIGGGIARHLCQSSFVGDLQILACKFHSPCDVLHGVRRKGVVGKIKKLFLAPAS